MAEFKSKYEIGDTIFNAVDDEDHGRTVTEIQVQRIRIQADNSRYIVEYQSEYNHWYNEDYCFSSSDQAFRALCN